MVESSQITLKFRVFLTIVAIFFFRLGSNIPIPGLDPTRMEFFFFNKDFFSVFDLFSGGAFSKLSIFSLGLMPYITASIVMQVLSVFWKPIVDLKKLGHEGQGKISIFIRCLAFFLAVIQSIGISFYMSLFLIKNDFFYFLLVTTTLITGSFLLIWISDIITKYGISNGVSLIIFFGIIVNLIPSVLNVIENLESENMSFLWIFILLFCLIFSLFIVVFFEQSNYKITVNYLNKQRGNKVYTPQKSFLPLKLNLSGVIAPIFSSSILLFPTILFQWFTIRNDSFLFRVCLFLTKVLVPGSFFYIFLYSVLIVFFCFLYNSVIFDSRDISDNLKKSGGFLMGCRPGYQTSSYISYVISRLASVGACYMVIVCFIPDLFMFITGVPFYFGGTSVLISVVVILDLIYSIQTHLLVNKYKKITDKYELIF